MTIMHIDRTNKNGRTRITIPAYIRDELDLQNKDRVDVKRVGRKIVITPGKKEDK